MVSGNSGELPYRRQEQSGEVRVANKLRFSLLVQRILAVNDEENANQAIQAPTLHRKRISIARGNREGIIVE